MKTQYKFMHFVKVEDKPKTSVWDCINNRSEAALGRIAWYPTWRQYLFGGFLFGNAVFSADCLRDIAEFLDALKAQRAEERENKQ